MKTVWLNSRCSPLRYCPPLLLLVGLLVLFGRDRYWLGIWPEAGAATGVAGYFCSLLTAGGVSWATARRRQSGLAEMALAGSVRGDLTSVLSLVGDIVWPVASYILLAATAAVASASEAATSGFGSFLGYVFLGLVLILLASAWGWVIGRLLDPVVAGLSAALGWFIIVTLLGAVVDAAPVSGPPWEALDPVIVAARFLFALLLLLALPLLVRAGARRSMGARVASTAAVCFSVVALAAAHVVGSVVSPRAPVASPPCVQGQIEYCLWPEDTKYVPMILSVDARVAALPLALPLPKRMSDYALSGSHQWVDGIEGVREGDFPPEFDISEGSRWALARNVAAAITSSTFAECLTRASLRDPQRRWDQLQAWLEQRLSGGGRRDYHTNAPSVFQEAWRKGSQVALWPAERQADWAREIIRSRNSDYCGKV